MAYRQRIGHRGEVIAEAFLHVKGLETVCRNFRTPYGEIDLIMKHKDQLVFVEVKSRTNLEFGLPEDSITAKKKGRMVRSAAYYIQKHSEQNCFWRIDVIAVYGLAGDPSPEIEWFENAIA